MHTQLSCMIDVSSHATRVGFRRAPRGRNVLLLTLLGLIAMAAVPDRRWAMAPAAAQCLISIRTRLSAATIDEPYVQRLSAGGGLGPYTYTLEDGSLPPGLQLSLLGTISGTPTDLGSYAFTVRVRDALNCVTTKAFNLDVGCPMMEVTPPGVLTGRLGQEYSWGYRVTGGNAPPYTPALTGTLSEGLINTASGGSGEISGTPLALGSYPFTISFTDANNCVAERMYTMVVACPVITLGPSELPDAPPDLPYEEALSASGGQEPYTFTKYAGTIPPGLAFSTDGVLSGVPTTESVYTFHVRATDPNGCFGFREFTLTVTQGTPPVPTITTSYTPSAAPTATRTATASMTRTRTTPTATWTATDRSTATRTRALTATSTRPRETRTASRTPTVTAEAMHTASQTATSTATAPATRTPTAELSAVPTFAQTATSTAVPTSLTATSTPPVASVTPTHIVDETAAATVTVTPSASASEAAATPVTASPTSSPLRETASPSPTPSPTPRAGACTGDCGGSGNVTIDELVLGVNLALGRDGPSECPAMDPNLSSTVEISELVDAVGHALYGCP